jgi:hypothetical protein
LILKAFSAIVNPMGKKRKTKQEKIILQLKRQLAQQAKKTKSPSIKFEPSQEAISKPQNFKSKKVLPIKKPDISVFSFDPKLIKKDLLKTAVLSLIIFSLEIVLYLKLR